MSDMNLVVVGAAGRMGLTLVRAIHQIEGARVAAAIERPGSEAVGRDIGELAGIGNIGVAIGDDPLARMEGESHGTDADAGEYLQTGEEGTEGDTAE